jgi:hypothetical protein
MYFKPRHMIIAIIADGTQGDGEILAFQQIRVTQKMSSMWTDLIAS